MSMLRTMVSQLVKHERIEITVAKAKEVRRLADNMVQLGKEVPSVLQGVQLLLCERMMSSANYLLNSLVNTEIELVATPDCCELVFE